MSEEQGEQFLAQGPTRRVGATPQPTRPALSAPSLRRKRHKSVMSIVMSSGPKVKDFKIHSTASRATSFATHPWFYGTSYFYVKMALRPTAHDDAHDTFMTLPL